MIVQPNNRHYFTKVLELTVDIRSSVRLYAAIDLATAGSLQPQLFLHPTRVYFICPYGTCQFREISPPSCCHLGMYRFLIGVSDMPVVLK